MKTTTLTTEEKLIKATAAYLKNAEVFSKDFGHGKVKKVYRDTFDDLMFDVEYKFKTRSYSLRIVMLSQPTNQYISLTDQSLVDIYKELKAVNDELQKNNEVDEEDLRAALVRAKSIKVDEQCTKMKAKAIQEFEDLMNEPTVLTTQADEFYYSLGWLAKHLKSVYAAMPDYLEPYFIKQFGSEAPHRAVDSSKRTINGFPTQWALGFTASIGKNDIDQLPANLTTYLSKTGKGLANTRFLWDLIENYGFRFGKKQDKEEILSHIPTQCISIFEAGFAS